MNTAALTTFSERSKKTPSFSDQQIRQIASRSSSDIANWIQMTARHRGIAVRRLPNQKFVKAVSRLSDGVVDLDPVEDSSLHWGERG